MVNPVIAVRNYFKDAVAELKKVTWPSRDLTIRYSMLVVTVSVALALFFAALDFGLSQGVTLGLSRKAATTTPTPPPAPVMPTVVETTGEGGVNITPVDPNTNGDITLPPISN